ncbi:AcrR family transcriptional regulator [Mycobacterium sp. MAA66]|uniref:TetR/AcrR family transcriptional regulator n=1 Tax=Mycobacterium sp. MAA66 TaxID=3156297 RepID=UPI003513E162
MSTTTAAPARERAAHLGPERRRPQILDVALEIAAAEGVSAVTIGAIATRLGVTRPVIYSCFSDRVELLHALLQREDQLLTTSLLEALHAGRGDDPDAALVTGYQALLHVVEQRPATWRLLFSANPDPAVAGMIATMRVELAASATRWIGPALEKWWQTTDLDRKLPVLIELFMSSSEAAARSLLDTENDWTAETLGEFYGRIMSAAFQSA